MDFEALVPDTSESEEGSPIQSWGIARSVPETTSEESQTEEEAVALCSGGLAAYDDDDNPGWDRKYVYFFVKKTGGFSGRGFKGLKSSKKMLISRDFLTQFGRRF